jgi:hypothetical protein
VPVRTFDGWKRSIARVCRGGSGRS